MGFLSTASIKTKLLVCFILVLVLSCIVSGLSIKAFSSSINVATDLQEKFTVNYARVNRVSKSVQAANSAMIAYLTPNSQTNENRNKLTTSLAEMDEAINVMNPEPEITKDYNELKKAINDYTAHYNNDIVQLINAHRPYEALEVYLNIMAPLSADMLVNVDEILSFRFDYIAKMSEELIMTKTLYVVVIITIIQILLSIAIAIFIANYIQSKIAQQCDVANKLADGDFTIKFPESTGDEFGTLNDTMRAMCTKLRETISTVVKMSNDINESMKHVEKSSSDICDAMSQSEQQAITVAASADEMVATTANIAKNCSDAADSSKDSANLTQEGMKMLNASANAILAQYESMKNNAATIQTLVDQAQKIGSIVGTIDEIAAQTNLLALNAAIEAARAGEAGRGFAVVADEVRALATRTTSSTQEIRGMVDRIQAETNNATTAMQANLDDMSEVASSTSAVQETLSNALNYVNEVNSQITQIATAAEEQTSATGEISNNMQNITRSSGEVNDIAQAARDISISTAQALDGLIHSLKFFKF